MSILEGPQLNFDKFIILDEGDITFNKPINQTNATGTIAHGFSKPVMVVGYDASDVDSFPLPTIQVDTTTGIINVLKEIEADDTNIYVNVYTPQNGTNYAASFSVSVHYFIIDKEPVIL